jgi:HTH domain
MKSMDAESLQELLDRAASGEKLDTSQRRCALKELRKQRPDLSNRELGRMLGVSGTAISNDLEGLEPDAPALPPSENPTAWLARLTARADQQIKVLEEARDKAKQGSREFMQYTTQIYSIESDLVRQKERTLKDQPSSDPRANLYMAVREPLAPATVCKEWEQMEPEEQEYMEALSFFLPIQKSFMEWEKAKGRGMPDRTNAWCSPCDGVRDLDPEAKGMLVCGHPDPCA